MHGLRGVREGCPVAIPNEWDVRLGTCQAIGRAFPQAIPITFTIDKKDRAPCVAACPAGINVQGTCSSWDKASTPKRSG